MLRAFVAKSWSDFRSEWPFGLVFFAVVVVAAATTVLALVVRTGGTRAWDDLFEATNGADLVLIGRPGGTDFSPLAGLEDIVESDGPHAVAGPYTLEGAAAGRLPSVNQVSLFAGERPPDVARPRIVSGTWPQDGGELLLGEGMAEEFGVGAGDEVEVRAAPGAGPVPFVVSGTAVSSTACPFVECDPQLGYVTKAGFDRVVPPGGHRDLLLLRLAEPERARAVVEAAGARLTPGAIGQVQLASNVRAPVVEETDVTVIAYAGLALVALLVVGVGLVNFTALRMGYLRDETALLRALGVTPGQATGLLAGQALVGGFNAFVVGSVLGVGLAALALGDLLDSIAAGPLPPLRWQDFVIAFLVVEAVVVVATIGPSWRAARRPIVTEPDPPAGGELVAGSARLPLPLRVGLTQVTSSRARLVVALATLTLGFAAVVLALGAVRTLDALVARPELLGDPFDVIVNDTSFGIAEAEALFAGDERVEILFTRADLLARLGSDGLVADTRLLGGDYASAPWSIGEGRMVAGPGEAVAGYGLLRALDVRVGDRLVVDTGAESFEVEIVGRHHESDDGGQVLLMDARTVTSAPPPSVLIGLAADADEAAVVGDLSAAFPGLARSVESPGPSSLARSLRPTTVGLAATLLALALANLAGTALLTVREHRRDIGVLKAIGFTPRGVLAAVTSANALVGAVASLAGVAVGLVTLRLLLARIGIDVGTGPDFGLMPQWWATASLVPIAVLAAAAVTVAVAWGAARVNPTDALRDE